jgi:hypothetical protein
MATWNKTDTETKEEIAQQEQKDKCECSSKIKSLENKVKELESKLEAIAFLK